MSQSNINKNTIIKIVTIGTSAVGVVIVACVTWFKKGVEKGLELTAEAMEAATTTIKTKEQENERLRRENDKLRKESNK
ncbi:hypothetical protein [uncultured Alistipes sp.]|uniref:hypothetical protein n=1 Tax=uncultured Alistipes sp. TaxID=538949 RepID=UPI0028058EAE|nr:hypothetical protein [uncultured Alistipes sp.]